MAYAVPRNAPAGNVEIVLPQPLPPSAVAQVQMILQLQAAGDDEGADRLIGRLDDTTLVGPILAARYLSPDYRSSAAQLESWYAQYGSQPEAGAIYQLLLHKLPHGAMPPPAPVVDLLPEPEVTNYSAARPRCAPDSAAWRREFDSGLADWRAGDLSDAGGLFQRAAAMGGISREEVAAAQFWAARAALRLQQPESYLADLHTAAAESDTFYGMLAGRLLGEGFGPTGIAATLTEADITAVDATPNGHLAFALLQVGQTEQAAQALRALWPAMRADADFSRAVMAVAARAGLVDVAVAISAQVPVQDNAIAGAALPMPALHPLGGFTVDPALVYALARTESGFDPAADSPAGARGLMQLMPVTAHYIGRRDGIAGPISSPAANLALGQAYVEYLGSQDGIDNNLLAILASYNAGPNAAAAWYDALRDDSDPLMFLETIPNDTTRRFVHQVLADSWIYAGEIGLEPSSLDELAEGNFPLLGPGVTASAAN
jgi:soluble lytic murein transglycosylase-like protein